MRRQVRRREERTGGAHQCPFEDISEFPHVTRPMVSAQDVQDFRRKSCARTRCWRTQFLDEVLGQQRDVFRPLAQRRNVNADDVEPEIEVLAESPSAICVLRLRFVAAITRTFTPCVSAVGADPLNFAALEKAEEHRLHAQAHLAHFVQEHGAVGRHLEQPGLSRTRR